MWSARSDAPIPAPSGMGGRAGGVYGAPRRSQGPQGFVVDCGWLSGRRRPLRAIRDRDRGSDHRPLGTQTLRPGDARPVRSGARRHARRPGQPPTARPGGGGRRAAVARPCDLRARLVRFDGRDGRGREPERIADAARRPRRLRPGAVRPWIRPLAGSPRAILAVYRDFREERAQPVELFGGGTGQEVWLGVRQGFWSRRAEL